MKGLQTVLILTLLFSHSVSAVKMYYPGNTDGQTAVDQSTTPPQYYPPAKPNPLNPNKNIPDKYRENTNVQGNTQMPTPATTSK